MGYSFPVRENIISPVEFKFKVMRYIIRKNCIMPPLSIAYLDLIESSLRLNQFPSYLYQFVKGLSVGSLCQSFKITKTHI